MALRRNSQAIAAVLAKLSARFAQLRGLPRTSPPPQASTVKSLDLINARFHASYDQARNAAKHEGPVFVVVGDELVVFAAGERHAFSFSPPSFHVIKSVAHAPVALYAMFAVPDGLLQTQLVELRNRVVTALESPAVGALEAESAGSDLVFILQGCRDFIDESMRANPSRGQLDAFASDVGPALLRLARAATSLQLRALHEHTESALRSLSTAQRSQLHVVVAGDHQARARSLAMQYFCKRFAEPAGAETRVTYAEGVSDEHSALQLVGTQRLDRSIARAFFGEEKRLQRDILGDAAESVLSSFELARALSPSPLGSVPTSSRHRG